MKEYKLNKEESLTVFEMVQDAIDRGMIASHYDINKLEDIISNSTTEFGDIRKGVEFEITIKVKE